MSRFFDSELVRESLFELDRLQEKLFSEVFQLPFFSKEQRKEHLDTMKEFLEKQKLFIFRMSLSDDPEALELKDKILKSAQMFGMNDGDTIQDFFDQMEESIEKLEQSLDI